MEVRILVTAGPTREFIDDVRFLSSPSSGRVGYEVAGAAAEKGHEVVLVSGPAALPDPTAVTVVHVVSADEMASECLSRFEDCDAVIMAAAVCDYKPEQRFSGKLEKKKEPLPLTLAPTTDILAQMGRRKKKQVLVGFALEVGDARRNAAAKLAAKNLNYIVVNSPETFASETISCMVIDRNGEVTQFDTVTKKTLAGEIVKLIEAAAGGMA